MKSRWRPAAIWLAALVQPSLFRSAAGRTGRMSGTPMAQADVFRMAGRRAQAAYIRTRIACHSFHATGITEYPSNGGKLEIA